MESIDRLRRWADCLQGTWIDKRDGTITFTTGGDVPPDMDSVSLRDHVNGVLDEIEREVGERYVALPLDADGEAIHAGDVLDGYGKTIEVVELRHGRSGWVLISRDGNGYADCAAFAHHHATTVEDVLREFTERVCDGLHTPKALDTQVIIAEYAARLRLAGDGE